MYMFINYPEYVPVVLLQINLMKHELVIAWHN